MLGGRWGRWLAAAMAATLALVTLPGVGRSDPAAATGPSTLTIAADTQMSTFNPFIAYYDGELNIIAGVYPALTMRDEHNQPQPYLASRWRQTHHRRTWVFTIRSGLRWTDGRPITAADIAWTYNLVMHDATAATANGALVANFVRVRAPNATTFVIDTKTPQANLLYLSLPVVPQHIWQSRVKNLKENRNTQFPVVGYGPWILTGYQTDQYATLRANTDFFLGRPKYDRLISYYYKSTDSAIAALKSGALQQGAIGATDYKALARAKHITTYKTAPITWTGLEINPGARTRSGRPMGTGNRILTDVRVRTAIAWAINRQQLVTKVLNGQGVPGSGYLPAGYPQWAWTPPADQLIGYDPDRANRILDQAGYRRGSDGVRVDPKSHHRLVFRLGIHSDETEDAQITNYLPSWLSAIGIKVTAQPMSFSALNDSLAKGDWDLLMDAWTASADPTTLLSIQTCAALPTDTSGTGGSTDAFFCDREYDRLFALQQSQFDPAQRAATIRRMQQILYKANVDIMFYNKNLLSAVDTTRVTTYTYGAADRTGTYPTQNVFFDWWKATPAAGTLGGSGSNAALGGLGIVILVAAAVAAAITLRRRSTRSERE